MIIYPAIDMRGGKVVRLREGDPNQQTVFGDDPIEVAARWLNEGSNWLHVVNLDGAFAHANDALATLKRMSALNANIQFGGGLRSREDIVKAFDYGASRVVLGTIAVNQPELVAEIVTEWGADRVCVALDSRGGKVTTHGWQQGTSLTPAELGLQMANLGVQHALYTDVSRDGSLEGVNIPTTAALGRETGLQVIASGGVSTLDEIRALRAEGVAGAVIGMALYQGRIALTEALAAAMETN